MAPFLGPSIGPIAGGFLVSSFPFLFLFYFFFSFYLLFPYQHHLTMAICTPFSEYCAEEANTFPPK